MQLVEILDDKFRGNIVNLDKNIISCMVSNYGDNVWKEMRALRNRLYRM